MQILIAFKLKNDYKSKFKFIKKELKANWQPLFLNGNKHNIIFSNL